MRLILSISSFVNSEKKRVDEPQIRTFSDEKSGVVVLFDDFVDDDGVVQADFPARRLTVGTLTEAQLTGLAIGDKVAISL